MPWLQSLELLFCAIVENAWNDGGCEGREGQGGGRAEMSGSGCGGKKFSAPIDDVIFWRI
jgi:hypothetical protein